MHGPFVYQKQVVAFLKTHDKLWKSFASPGARQAGDEAFKAQLLKDTLRLSPDAEPLIYAAVEKARTVLDITEQVTVYQSMQSTPLNAGVYTARGEAHIVCPGNLWKLLDEKELLAVIAHKLGHIRLFTADDGDYLVADRILHALTTGADSPRNMWKPPGDSICIQRCMVIRWHLLLPTTRRR